MSADQVLDYMTGLGREARAASRVIARATTAVKNKALLATADAIEAAADSLIAANALDLQAGRDNGLDEAMIDRLAITPSGLQNMVEGLRQVAALPDPIGAVRDMKYLPSGIQVGRMRVPLGVVGIIYESRPNVTADAAGLCLKSGNASILRGGSEALHSNQAIAASLHTAMAAFGVPAAALSIVSDLRRAAMLELLLLIRTSNSFCIG